jgi:uncharacterized membrane protein YfhO
VDSYGPGHISVDLSSAPAEGSVLVLSENNYPGWKATGGNGDLAVSRVNFNLIGVGLTPATRHIDLAFVDPIYSAGKITTLASLLVAVIALVAGVFMDRRRTIGPAAA